MSGAGSRPRSLVRVLVALKVRLQVNRARSTRGGWFGLVASLLFGAALAVAGLLIGLAAGQGASEHARRVVLEIAPNVLVLAWAVLPLATFGSDETLDPSRLVLFPLRRRPLMQGLFVASFVGPVPIAAAAATAGVVIGFGGVSTLALGVPAGLLVLALATATSRALSTTLAAALSSRRSRDAAIVVGSLLAVSFQLVRFIRLPRLSTSSFDGAASVAQWTPPGLLGRSLIEARAGHWLTGIACLLPAIALVPVLMMWWGRSLERALTVVASGSTPARRGRRGIGTGSVDGIGRRRVPLLPAWLPFLPANAWGAAAARDLRYSWRDPRRKSSLLVRTLLAIGGPVWLLVQGDPSGRGVLLATFVAYIAVLGSFNQFGYDGGALWSDLLAGDRLRTLLLGKNVSALVQVVPAVVLSAIILAAATGGWPYVPAALFLSLGAVGVGLGVADVVSIRLPFKMPDNRNAFGGGAFGSGGGGQGFVTGLTLFGASIVQNVLMAPVAIAAGITLWVAPAALIVVAPLATAYGYAIWRAALSMAVREGWWREPELLAAVDPARSN